ncbi:UDP-2,3-diacylglucosamine diphosphatase [Paraferrimonas haliotis]|uniref:UDP-2,3-diacylglucosamine hydrolase n=1 Tax=Paraferrimonas haliotis TaxID=2013866 RepID=A0AA37WXK6_9GAMM|nr:UDP-2,3-diacylglucosamine diphosphatase [Paraferrimonas haliotis]GLS82580.1 UDP-2,3-diacylglucosamine hydrolase [Paraferrimonas haliotis]
MLKIDRTHKRTVFIADLHLSGNRPDINSAFKTFIQSQRELDALFIMGDLFEYWIGDDIAEPFALEVAQLIKQASSRFPIYYTHGNRDFLIDNSFAQLSGMTLLPEVQKIDLYGRQAIVAHGDSLCTDDHDYQKFRRFRNQKWARWLYLHLPKKRRQKIADGIRENSASSKQGKTLEIMDVNASAVEATLNQYQAQLLIHGHTHRPFLHDLKDGRKRWVVGDWYQQTSALVVSDTDAQLISSEL